MSSTLQLSMDIRNTVANLARTVEAFDITTSGGRWDIRKLNIGTSEETITISSDITGGNFPGFCFLYNADPTNFVKVGRATGTYFARLSAGWPAILPLESTMTQLFMIADTAACDVEMMIFER